MDLKAGLVASDEAREYGPAVITAGQIRAARALLNWKQGDLAREAGLSVTTVKTAELGTADPRGNTLTAIQGAFDRAGLVFLEEGDTRDGGAGVRLKKKPPGEG